MTEQLQFDEASHTYSEAGLVIPSVTQALGASGLVDYEGISREVLDRKAVLGDAVHQATRFYDEEDLDWESLSPEAVGYVYAWERFRKDSGFVPRLMEHRHIAEVSRMKYGMQIDREGELAGKPTILEIKCTASVEAWHGVQLAGYALGLPDEKHKIVGQPRLGSGALFFRRGRAAVQLRPDGKYSLHAFTDAMDAQIFLSALAITWWRINHGLKLEEV